MGPETTLSGAPGRADVYRRIYAIIREIPRGRVATYGQVAAIEGHATARMVGHALARGSVADVPWQRVINSAGRISERGRGGGTASQRIRLMAEGVRFDRRGRVDFERFGWDGPDWGWIYQHNMFPVPRPGRTTGPRRRSGERQVSGNPA